MFTHCKKMKQVTLFITFLLLLIFFNPTNSKAASKDFDIKNGVLIKYKGNSSKVTIPNTVKTIGNNAFMSNNKIKSVTIPSSVTKIEEYAFANCNNLATIKIPDSVTSIGTTAFANCFSLKTIKLPNKLKVISTNTFSGCLELNTITIPVSVTEIGSNAFSGCEKLTSIKVPKNVKTIGEGAFSYCIGLKKISIPDKVVSINDNTFYNCTSLQSITLPKNITFIGKSAFYNCINLESITIPDTVTEIGDFAFESCKKMQTFTFPKKITIIGEYILYECVNLKTVNLPTTVTKIGQYAFAHTNLTNFTLPTSIKEIESKAFLDTPWLKSKLKKSPFLIENKILFDASSTSGTVTVPNGVVEIAPYAFRYSSANEIILPDSVTKIGTYALASSKIKKVTLNEGLKEIDECAFLGSHISKVTIPSTVTSIKANAFAHCDYLKSIVLPEGITTIETGTFSFCEKLTSITIPKSVVTIDKRAFERDPSLIDIQVDTDNPNYSGVGNLLLNKDKTQLIYCTMGIKDVVIPEGVEIISSNAFNYTDITKVTFPSTLKEMYDDAFYLCPELTEIVLPSSLSSFGLQKFEYCIKLSKFTVFETSGATNFSSDDGVLYNGDKTILICDPSSGSTVVKDHVTAISAYAFPNARDSIIIPKSVVKVDENVLNLDNLYKPADKEPFHVYGYKGSIMEKYCTDNYLSFLAYDATYTISYVLNGGTNSKNNPTTYDYNSDAITFEAPTRKGYVFLYWYEDVAGCEDGCHRTERIVSVLPEKSLGNIELIAKWEKINIGKTVVKSIKKSSSSQINLAVQAIKNVTGYEVLYSKNSNFTSSKTLTSNSSAITINQLSKGSTYYIKVRAYRLDSTGNKVYGDYSNVSKIKIS